MIGALYLAKAEKDLSMSDAQQLALILLTSSAMGQANCLKAVQQSVAS
jgi:hypothetical protein